MKHDLPQHAIHDDSDDDNDDDNLDILVETINIVEPRITHMGEALEELLMDENQMFVLHGSEVILPPVHITFPSYVFSTSSFERLPHACICIYVFLRLTITKPMILDDDLSPPYEILHTTLGDNINRNIFCWMFLLLTLLPASKWTPKL